MKPNFINQIEPLITISDRTAINDYLSSGGWLTEHIHTRQFEEQLASYVGAKYASIVPNGTIGLYLALRSLGLGRGDYIAVPAYTMIATINAIIWAGALPVLIDIDPATACMDINKLKETSVQAVLYVEINGRHNDIDQLIQFCTDRKIRLIEDSCQALGSKYKDRYMGTLGDAGVYSFSPHKIITTGQGGAIVTNNEEVHRKVAKLKDFGRAKAGIDWHTEFGVNFKYTDLQAVIGKSQLSQIEVRINKKLHIYYKYLAELPKRFIIPPLDKGNVPWFIDLLCEDHGTRNDLITYLKDNDIGSRPFYPPLIDQPCCLNAYSGTPQAKQFAYRGVWLPSSLTLTDQQIDYILEKLHKF